MATEQRWYCNMCQTRNKPKKRRECGQLHTGGIVPPPLHLSSSPPLPHDLHDATCMRNKIQVSTHHMRCVHCCQKQPRSVATPFVSRVYKTVRHPMSVSRSSRAALPPSDEIRVTDHSAMCETSPVPVHTNKQTRGHTYIKATSLLKSHRMPRQTK